MNSTKNINIYKIQKSNLKNLYEIWLYFIKNEKWEYIICLYKSLYRDNYEFYTEFKKYIDLHSEADSDGNVYDNLYFYENMPLFFRNEYNNINSGLVSLSGTDVPKVGLVNSAVKNREFFSNDTPSIRKIHIISDIDDTILKKFHLPKHDYSMKCNNWNEEYYPYLYEYFNDFIRNHPRSSGFVSFCTIRGNYLSNYTKSQLYPKIYKFNVLFSENFLFLYYTFIIMISNTISPFTVDWFHHYYYAGISKFNKILNFIQMYPEYDFCFFGDTGEGDLITGSLLLLNDMVKYIFLNDIKDHENQSYLRQDSKLHVTKNDYKFYFHRIENRIDVSIIVKDKLMCDSKKIYLFQNFDKQSIHNIFEYFNLDK